MEKIGLARILFCIVLITALILYTFDLRERGAVSHSLPALDRVPPTINGFESSERFLTDEEIKILGADKTLYRIYSNESGRVVRLFIGYFSTQQENSQIHSPKHCYPGAGWNIASEGKTKIRIDGRDEEVKYILISNGPATRLVMYWFRTFDAIASNEFELKWIQMKNAIMRKPQMAAFIRLSTDLQNGTDLNESLGCLKKFAEAVSPSIEDVLLGVQEK